MPTRPDSRRWRAAPLLLGAWLGMNGAPAVAAASLQLEPCRISDQRGLASHEARCGRLRVAENPDEPAGRMIELAVAVLPAVATKSLPDPLFLLAGGPGQGAREGYAPHLGAFAGLRRERDIVLVDQRGTGDSNRLDCEYPEEGLESGAIEPGELLRLTRACLAALPGRPEFYTTSIAVRDLDAVRAALGYQRINLFGGSYGTRVAQHYARRYPERTRTITLDSVVPPGLALGPDIALAAQRALDAVFARCAADAGCAERFPDLPAGFAALATRLAERPVTLAMPDPMTGQPREIKVGREHVVLAARMLAYSSRSASLLPWMIHEAGRNGNLLPLAAQAEMAAGELKKALAFGMHNSVVCSEDAPRAAASVDRDALAASFIGTAMYDDLMLMCSIWPRGPVDADFNEPLDSSVPALLLSGTADPATPAAYGTEAAAGLAGSLHLVFEGQGHGQTGLPCARQLIRKFVMAGTAQGLDTACVNDIRPAPPFLTGLGPAP